MNRNIIIGVALVTTLLIGLLLGRAWSPHPAADAPGDAQREVLYWVAPMDPNFRRDEPGKSPMGMDLVPVYADAAGSAPGVVSIDPTMVNNLGVRTAVAERGTLPRIIETVGYIGYDEDTLQHVHTRVDGWIEKLATTATGDPVSKGQLLFELYSPTLVNAQQEYLAALASKQYDSQERITRPACWHWASRARTYSASNGNAKPTSAFACMRSRTASSRISACAKVFS